MKELEQIDAMTARIDELETEIEDEASNYTDFDFPEDSLIKRLINERKSLVMDRALLSRKLKSNGDMPYTILEQIVDELNETFPDAKSNDKVELNGENYLKRFQPVELSKNGKSVKQYWTYWLRLNAKGTIDEDWKTDVHNLWPDMFLIKADRNKARKC